MEWLKPTLWGAFGGLAIEALDYITAVRKHRRLPWQREKDTDPGPLAYGIATVLRITIGSRPGLRGRLHRPHIPLVGPRPRRGRPHPPG